MAFWFHVNHPTYGLQGPLKSTIYKPYKSAHRWNILFTSWCPQDTWTPIWLKAFGYYWMHQTLNSHYLQRGGHSSESAHLPPICGSSLLMVDALLLGFSSRLSLFLPMQKTNITTFQFDQDRDSLWKPAEADLASSLNIVIYLFNWHLGLWSISHQQQVELILSSCLFLDNHTWWITR